MEALPEIDWYSRNLRIKKANNRLLYDAFPNTPESSIRAYKSTILKEWRPKN
jgi:hypothetical protein